MQNQKQCVKRVFDMTKLTIDEIHVIREEHVERTKHMSFAEYKKDLDREVAPILAKLRDAKRKAHGA